MAYTIFIMNSSKNDNINGLKTVLKKSLLSLTVFHLFVFTAFAQSDFNFDLDSLNTKDIFQADFPDLEINLAPAPINKSIEPLALKDWTIIVYMNGKNNLEAAGLADINEMEEVGSSSGFNIIVEFGRMDGHSSSDGNWTGAKRYFIEKDNDSSKINSPEIMAIPKVNMGDWRHLVDFVKWAKVKYPAKRYMLIMWNHGGGWLKDNPVSINKGISYDDETGNNIDTPQLGKALGEIGKIDIYASDACLMQMAEVNYQIKDSVDYIVGSEAVEISGGYDYDAIFESLRINSSMSVVDLAKKIVDSYFHTGDFSLATQSVIKADKLRRLPALTDDFIETVMAADIKGAVKKARDEANMYKNLDNKDLYGFVANLVEGTKNKAVKAKGKALMKFLKNRLIIHNGEEIGSFDGSNGISVYLPSDKYNRDYNELKWAKDSKWDEFIRWQLD